ncbi:MAG: glycerol-3-phosphate acyltransferase, partial [Bdellovibrionota bacterium]
FRGGKGVATGFGAVLMLSPLPALIGIAGFAFAFLARRISSLASITGLLLASAAQLIFRPMGAHLWFGAAMIAVILFRHEDNLDALLENREKSFR